MDRISKPTKGRFFPISVAEIRQQLKVMDFFASQEYYLEFCNPISDSEFGMPIAVFEPHNTLILFSYSEEFNIVRARNLIFSAFQEFIKLGGAKLERVEQGYRISIRAYLGQLNQLVITKHKRKATGIRYRNVNAKFSNAFKPKKIRTDEIILYKITI